jgi:DNA repair exonuclease SbcCD ATPase subunit
VEDEPVTTPLTAEQREELRHAVERAREREHAGLIDAVTLRVATVDALLDAADRAEELERELESVWAELDSATTRGRELVEEAERRAEELEAELETRTRHAEQLKRSLDHFVGESIATKAKLEEVEQERDSLAGIPAISENAKLRAEIAELTRENQKYRLGMQENCQLRAKLDETREHLTQRTKTAAEYQAERDEAKEAVELLRRIVKYAIEDRAYTPGSSRLARAVNRARKLLGIPPVDLLRVERQPEVERDDE